MGQELSKTAAGANRIKDEPEVYAALIDGFSKGFTDSEACLAAGISKWVLYSYIDMYPEFGERKEQLKKNPILTAKTHVVSKLSDDTNTAKWYLERRTKEFRPPDRNQGNTNNTLILMTESQLKDRLAHKLSKLLTVQNEPVDVIDAECTSEMSNNDDLD